MSKWGPWSSVDWSEPTSQDDIVNAVDHMCSKLLRLRAFFVLLTCVSLRNKEILPHSTARRREAPSIVLKDQDSDLFGVAPEYDRLIVAECLFCDAVRRIECIAQHMLDEHPDDIEKKTLEASPDRVHENHAEEPQQSESWFVESQQIDHNAGLPAPPGGFIETLVIKKRNPSRRRPRPPNASPEVVVSSASPGSAQTASSINLKRGSVKSFLEPSLKRKFSLEKDREYDPNEHCGVLSEPNGKPCCYALGACKAHPVRHRRAVPGRRTSYDELVLEHRARAVSGAAASSDRVTTEMSEGSMSVESPAASSGSKSDFRDFEIAVELDQNSGIDVSFSDGVPQCLKASLMNGVASGIGTCPESSVSHRLEIPDEVEVSDEIDFLAGTEIVGELPPEAEVSADSMVFAGVEFTPENKTPSETEGRSRFTFENSSHRADATDDIGMMAEDIEITSEEILTTTIGGVPTTTGGILHITDAALTNDVCQLSGPKAADELTTIYEVIAFNSPDSMGNLTVENGGEAEPLAPMNEAFLLSHGSFESGLDEQRSRKDSMFLNHVTSDAYQNGMSGNAEQTNVSDEDLKSLSRSSESAFLVGPPLSSPTKFHPGVTAASTASESSPSPFPVESSTLSSPLTSGDLRGPEDTTLEIGSRVVGDLKTDAQNRSSVFLDDTANRFAVIVDPNKDTILSSLLFPSRYAASQNKSELSLRSTTSSTDQLFSEPAAAVVPDSCPAAVHDGKLRNLLTRGEPRSRSSLYHRRTERASQDTPGSSGAIADSPIPESGNGKVEIPIKKKRIHWMVPAQANHLNRICRLNGENLPEYLRVYLRRPQLGDLRDQQNSSMSMSDDLSEVLE